MPDIAVKDNEPDTFPELIKEAVVIKSTSKAGNDYVALRLKWTNGYENLVFFDRAESFMVEAEIDKLLK